MFNDLLIKKYNIKFTNYHSKNKQTRNIYQYERRPLPSTRDLGKLSHASEKKNMHNKC
jgi:hypothetical protein